MRALGSSVGRRSRRGLALVPAFLLAAGLLALPAGARANSPDHFHMYDYSNTGWVDGIPKTLTLVVLGPDSSSDNCFGDTVHFSDPNAVVPADYTFVSLLPPLCIGDNGQHQFTVTPIKAGTHTLTITDVNDPSLTDTLQFDVAPGPVASLTVTDLPAATTQGAETAFRVTLKDSWGSVASNYAGTVTFTSSDSSAGLPGPQVFNAGDAGSRLFTVNFETTGNQSVTVADAANSSLHATASTNVQTADYFDVEVGDQQAGVYTTCSVTARKPDGSTDTGYTGVVRFTSSDSYVILPSDASNVPGQITFTSGMKGDFDCYTSDLMFHRAGAQTLTATDKSNSFITGTGAVTVSGGDTVAVAIVGLPSEMVAGPVTITVTATDGWGNWGSDGTLHFTSSDSRALLPADFAFHKADYGKRRFTVTLESPGARTLAVSGSEAGTALSSQVATTVYPAAAATLSVTGVVSPTASGAARTMTVRARDAYGNPASSYTGTVHFTSTDPAAVLPANYTFTAGDAGVHTFNVTFKTAGARTLTATDTVSSSIKGSQAGIVVNPAALAKLLVYGLPTPRVAGTAGSFAVTANDAYGNRITTYTGTVHFTSTDPAAVLPADATFTGADHGAKVLNVTFKTAGTRTLTATDTVSSSIKGSQAGIVVNPAALAKLLVYGLPTPRVAGTAGSFAVTANDAYGNRITTYTGTVHFTSTDPAAVLPADATFTGADHGAKVLNVTFKTAGTRTLTATDTVSSSIKGSQAGIVVNPAAASRLVLSGFPNPTTSGAAHPVTATARDAYGNIATGYLGTIHFSSSDPGAGLPANYTFAAADGGVHAFAVTLNSVGTRSISATDTVNVSIAGSQAGIVVNP